MFEGLFTQNLLLPSVLPRVFHHGFPNCFTENSNPGTSSNFTGIPGINITKLSFIKDGFILNFSSPLSYISFSSFTFRGSPYWIFLLYLLRLPCHFYPVVIEQQQHKQSSERKYARSLNGKRYDPMWYNNHCKRQTIMYILCIRYIRVVRYIVTKPKYTCPTVQISCTNINIKKVFLLFIYF